MDFDKLCRAVLAEHQAVFDKLDRVAFRAFVELLKKSDRVFAVGVGREGLATRSLAMRLTHLGKESHWIWDDTTPGLQPGDLLVATLGDGQIGHLDYVCRRAKEAGAFLCVVTGSPSGRTARELADQTLFLPASVYRGVDEVVPSIQPMGNLFEQCLFILFDLVVMTIVAETPGLSFEQMAARHRNVE
ncbi:MAG: 6-phospho-3-hexuloisomerase [Deltaproteobacteria bacterium]|nr:6-phospho-3-hexuloisomerase [Deltaproteobacteria bacterium]